MANWLDVSQKFLEAAQPVVQGVANYAQERSRFNTQQEAQRKAALTPGLTPEQQYLAQQQTMNQIAPPVQMEYTQQETMTPFQKFMSNAALAGSIPGQLQSVAPGLLPALSNVPGLGRVTDLLRPDTSYLDQQAQRERERFQREVVPQIVDQYGTTRGSAVQNAIAAQERALEDRLSQQRVQAYESGLQRQQQGSQNLLNIGMQPQFQLAPTVKEQDMSPYQKALSVKDPKTGEIVSLDEFAKTIAGGKDSVLGKQFSAAVEGASPEQAFYIKNVLSKYTDRKSIPNIVKSLKTPEQFEAYYKMANNGSPFIKSIADKASKSADGRKNIEALYKAVQNEDEKALNKIAKRYNVKDPNRRSKGRKFWDFIKGPVFWSGQDWKTKGPVVAGSLAAAGMAASGGGIAPALSLVGSMLGSAKQGQ